MIIDCTAAVNVIRQLADEPSLTSAELKAAFDEAAQNIKDWLNDEFIPCLRTEFDTKQDLIQLEPNSAIAVDENGNIAEAQVSVNELSYLSGITANVQTQLDQLEAAKQPKITYGTTSPTGGSNGDIYIQYS